MRGGKFGEHVVSECLWKDDASGLPDGLFILGGPWAPTEPKAIGLEAIKSNILCQRHNSMLSRVDTEGGHAFDAVRKVDLRTRLPRRRMRTFEPLIEYRISRPLLERWFVKTTINLAVTAKPAKSWQLDRGEIRKPPPELVRAAFGLEGLAATMGLYALVRVGETFLSDDRVVFTALVHKGGGLAGAEYRFRGLSFIAWLVRDQIPELRAQFDATEVGQVAPLLVHSMRWEWQRDGRVWQAIELVG